MQRLRKQSNEIEKIVRDSQVFAHIEAENQEWLDEQPKGTRVVNVLDLLDPQYFNDIQVLVMQEAESLTEFLEIYETWDFLQFFKLSALKLAVKCNKVIKPQKVIVASKRK